MFKEFRVNNNTSPVYNLIPKVAPVNGIGFVICWRALEDFDHNIYAKIYDYNGEVIKKDFIVNSPNLTTSFNCDVTNTTTGFIIAWQNLFYNSRGSDIYFKRYDFDGNTLQNETIANDIILYDQSSVSISSYSNGEFILSWNSIVQVDPSSKSGIKAKIFNKDGSSKFSEFDIHTYDGSFSYLQSSVKVLSNNKAILTFVPSATNNKPSLYTLYGCIIDQSSKISNLFKINDSKDFYIKYASVSIVNDQIFFVGWQESTSKTNDIKIKGKFFSNSQIQVGSELTMSENALNENTVVAGASLGKDFLVVWDQGLDQNNNTIAKGISGMRVFSNLSKNDNNFIINDYYSGVQESPNIASLEGGGAVVVWESTQQSSFPNVYAKILDREKSTSPYTSNPSESESPYTSNPSESENNPEKVNNLWLTVGLSTAGFVTLAVGGIFCYKKFYDNSHLTGDINTKLNDEMDSV